MTNVPNNIREMWADVYKLFDINYKMPNTKEAWEQFWKQGVEIVEKYKKDCHFVSEMVVLVSEIIEEPMKEKLGIVNPCTYEDMKLF